MAKGKEEEDPKDDLAKKVANLSRNMGVFGNVYSRVTNKLIASLKNMDQLAKSSMAVGVRTHDVSIRLANEIEGLPGGMRLGLESAVGFMHVGLKDVSKGMIRLANQAKVTGQDSQAVIAGFAKLSAAMPISNASMGSLGDEIIDLSLKWGIKTTALIGTLDRHSDTLSKLSALGTDFGEAGKAMNELITQSGPQFAGIAGDLAKMLTFEGGFDDLSKAIITVGDQQVIQGMRTGDITTELLRSIAESTVGQFNTLVSQRGDDRVIKSAIAQQLGFSLTQVSQMEAMLESLNTSKTIEEMGFEELNGLFHESLGTLIREIAAPIQMVMIPVLTAVASAVSVLSPMFTAIAKLVSYFVPLATAILAHQVWEKANEARKMLFSRIGKSLGGLAMFGKIGLAIGAIVGVGMLVHDLTKTTKTIAKDKERTERLQRSDAGLAKRHWKETMTGQIIAVSRGAGEALLPDETVQFYKNTFAALMMANQQRDAQYNSQAVPIQ